MPIPIPRSTERQLLLFDINDLTKPKGEATLEVSPSTLLPHFDKDTNVLFLAGKGDRSVYAFEFIPGQLGRATALFGVMCQNCTFLLQPIHGPHPAPVTSVTVLLHPTLTLTLHTRPISLSSPSLRYLTPSPPLHPSLVNLGRY